MHHEAVDLIGQHVKKQANADNVERLPEKKEGCINHHCIVSMQWMEINAAPACFENRICE